MDYHSVAEDKHVRQKNRQKKLAGRNKERGDGIKQRRPIQRTIQPHEEYTDEDLKAIIKERNS